MINIKKPHPFRSIRTKLNLAVIIGAIVLVIFSIWLLNDSMNMIEENLMDSRLESNIKYVRDYLGDTDGDEWNKRDGALYIGNKFIGDGTLENANEEPFYHCENITGTFFYTFVKTDNDDELVWVGDDKTGYQQGHYLRTAGTTKGPNGERLEGTYIDKKVADVLENSENGVYSGRANVNGRIIYCRYELLKNSENENVGVIVVGRSIEEMNNIIRTQRIRGIIIIFFIMFLFSVGLAINASLMVNSIKKINERLHVIGTGTFPDEPLIIKSKDELCEVADHINNMVLSLKDKERIGAELDVSADIQAHMLPNTFPAFPDHGEFDLFATMEPAKEVGGDFYDYFMIDDNHIALIVADVSGKGIPAAMLMVISKTLIKDSVQSGLSPAETFTKVNNLLFEGNEPGLFVTAWMGILDLKTGILTYVNAGHNPPLIKLKGKDFEFLKMRPGFVLAGLDNYSYKQFELKMEPGDRLFLYTDGVTESTSTNKELYGNDRLKNYLNSHAADSAVALLKGLRKNIDEFVNGAGQFDDITMFVFDYNKEGDKIMKERTFSAEVSNLDSVIAFVEEELENAECSMKTIMQTTVCVEEIFVNVASYAYPDNKGDVLVTITEDTGTITISFTDSGIPFNPLEKEDPDISASAEDRKIGGLGIFMVKQSMDDVIYERKDNQNILIIKKEAK